MIGSNQKSRVKTPTIIQMEAVECGVVSLSIILGYFKRYIPLEELRFECGVSRDGSSAKNIIDAAKKYGLEGVCEKKSFEELKKMKFPLIAFWEFNHFLVIEGINGKYVFLNDPAVGPRKVLHKEFCESFSGYIISIEKSSEFKEGGKPFDEPLLSIILRRCKNSKSSFTYLFISGLCLLLPGFAMPAYLMVFLDMFFGKKITPWTNKFILAVFFTAVFALILHLMQRFVLNKLNVKLSLWFSSEFLWKLLKLPSSFYSQRYSGEIAWRMTLTNQTANILTNFLTSAFIDLLLVSFYGILLFFYNVYLASTIIIIAALNLLIMKYVFKNRSNAYVRFQQSIGKLNSESMGGIQFIETIKSKGLESDFFSRWSAFYTRKINSVQNIGWQDAILLAVPMFFHYFSIAVLLSVGSYLILKGSMSVPVLFAMQLLAMNFLIPITRFVGYSQLIQDMKIDMRRMDDVLKNPDDEIYEKRSNLKDEQTNATLKGTLEFKNVNFRYAPLSPLVIENLSFKINPGERIAFVGSTGCGKSTISKLVMGIYTPESGEILIDNKPIDQIPHESIRSCLSSVDQDILIFSGTIRENLSFWNDKATDKMLVRAAKDACIHSEIIERDEGYDTVLEQGGVNFSSGQRQRLEIARALLYSPSILVLDEATSALDSFTENKIMSKLRKRGVASLIIAHRLSSIRDCDRIYVLEKGKIIQEGTHIELKKNEGIYKLLVESESFDA